MRTTALTLACLFSLFCQAQKLMKKITVTENSTLVDVYKFRNGDSGNVIGPRGFNVNLSDGGGFSFYDPKRNTHFSYTQNCSQVECFLPVNESQFCNGNFQNVFSQEFTFTNYYGFDSDNVQHFFDISPVTLETERDEISDGNSNIDLLHTRFLIPNRMDDQSLVPKDTWVVLFSGNAVDLDLVVGNNGVVSYIFSGIRMVFKFDGTQWIEQNYDWDNNYIEPISSECDVIVQSSDSTNSLFDVYPNPTQSYVTINREIKNNTTTTYSYSIIDMNGKTVQVGNAKIGEPINIEMLITGHYIINILKEDDVLQSNKIIKI